MSTNDTVKFVGQVERIVYFNDTWGIVICSVIESEKDLETDYNNCVCVKGSMPEPIINEIYNIKAKEVYDTKYGRQYETTSISLKVDINDDSGKRKYLERLFTERQVKEMYKVLDDPFDTLKNNNFVDLVQVKGCGTKLAIKWCEKFKENYDLCRIYTELDQYMLSNSVIKKLVDHYKSVDVVIEKIKKNPYSLTNVKGIGWSVVDKIALEGGMRKYDPKRIAGYIIYYLNHEITSTGSTWVYNEKLMDNIVYYIGEDVPDRNIAIAIHTLAPKLWWSEDKNRIGLKSMRILEENLATELLRIRDSENNFKYGDWIQVVRETEQEQGWEFSDQQIKGIKLCLENNLVVIHGLAGTGKSTLVNVLLKILKDYTSATCALAGRAGARLAEVSGKEGYTIHRLLGYPSTIEFDRQNKQGFTYHDECKLPYDVIVVDEISMIGGRLFYYLLRAIKTGAKVILMGDIGQLESIGECKVAVDVINFPGIATMYLDKIHRQAQKSAIITESIKMRKGKQIINEGYAGIEVRGKLKDLELNIYSDLSNTYYTVLQYVSILLEKGESILDIQVTTPQTRNGNACTGNLNKAIQSLYNPEDAQQKEIIVNNQGRTYCLREGDKIINIKNNKNTIEYSSGKVTPIYNGNIGIIAKIIDDKTILIDFKNIGRIMITGDQVKFIELGYAITIHKMQGDQSKFVIVAIDNSSYKMLSREMIYTAVTRASQKCFLVAQNSALRIATKREAISVKHTSLEEILYEKTHPKLDF